MPGMQVRLSASMGTSRLRDGDGRQLVGVAVDSVGLWSIDLSPGSSPVHHAAQAGRFDYAVERRGPWC
jgi:hypothetical protein